LERRTSEKQPCSPEHPNGYRRNSEIRQISLSFGTRTVSTFLELPILSELVPGFDYGKVLLIEFEAQSLWYEASFTITSAALKKGIRTEYHTFSHIPNDIRESLSKHGLVAKALEQDKILRIIDSYTIQTGLGTPDPLISGTTGQKHLTQSVKMSEWSIAASQQMKQEISEEDMRWLHVDDNVSGLADYNDEKTILNYWRTRMIPAARMYQEAFVNALLVKVHSDSFYTQFEALCDGILDFRSREDGDRLVQEARARLIRGKSYDSKWRQLKLGENGEVSVSQ